MYPSEMYPLEISLTLIIQLLAILSVSASAGMRIGLPLLVIGLLNIDHLWSQTPILSHFHPQVLIAIRAKDFTTVSTTFLPDRRRYFSNYNGKIIRL